jgi:DDE family transposase
VALLGAPRMQRFSEPPPLCEPADAVERMRHRLKTRAGRGSYGKRKQTVEPVFGIIRAGMRVRQFLLRRAFGRVL